MTTLGSSLPTLADVTRLTGPDAKPLKVAEMLEQSTPIVKDATLIEGNLPSGNRTAVRVLNPVVSLRRLNEGVASSKSTFAARDESCSIIETWFTMDEKVLQMAADPGYTRELYARGDIEAMGQKAEDLFWYGSEADDDREFNGVFSRADYNTQGTQTLNASAGGATGSTYSSIVLIGWGPDKVALMYPKNSRAGLYTRDWGLSPVQTSTNFGGTTLAGWRMQYTWDIGLTIIDPRYIVRIANVPTSDALGVRGTQDLADYGTNIIFKMAEAIHAIPNINACKPVFYMPRSLATAFDIQLLARTAGNAFETRQIEGEWLMTFRGIPIRITDRLGYTETAVTFT